VYFDNDPAMSRRFYAAVYRLDVLWYRVRPPVVSMLCVNSTLPEPMFKLYEVIGNCRSLFFETKYAVNLLRAYSSLS
jgi:hypothetical protein